MRKLLWVIALWLAGPQFGAAQPPPGNYQDSRTLPDTPAAQRVREIVDLINSGDRERARSYVAERFAEEFREALPLPEHLGFFQGARHITGGVELYAVRTYEPPRPAAEITAILRAKLTESWLGLTLTVEPEPPHRIARLMFGPARPPTDAPRPPPLTAEALPGELKALLDKLAQADVLSGTVLLAKDGKVLLEYACGEASKSFGAANRIDTKLNLGSMNKMFTAVAVCQLVEQDKLKLDDPVSKFLDESWLAPDVARRITIRHLLTHTSGLGSYFNDEFEASSRERFREIDDYKPLVAGEKTAFEPGTQWAYSNTGFLLLGAIIEKATGGDYFDYVREHVYKPAGMTATDCYDMDRPNPNLAIGYTRVPDEQGFHWENNLFKHVIRGGPAGGGFSTVGDLLRFDQALRARKLVGEKTLEQMWTATPQSLQGGGGLGYGYGFGVQAGPRGKVVGHGGGFPGISAKLDMYLDAGYTLVVLCNYDDAAELVSQRVAELIARVE